MPDTQPTDIKNLDLYGHDPHSAGIAPAPLDGGVFFTSSPVAPKAKDLAASPARRVPKTAARDAWTCVPRIGFHSAKWPLTRDPAPDRTPDDR